MPCVYLQCRDTFWVESFNHQLLAHIPKRVHFGSSTFEMRMNRTIMDWVCCTMYCIQIFDYRTRMLDCREIARGTQSAFSCLCSYIVP